MSYDPYSRQGPYETGSYTTDTSTPWALIPGGRQLSFAAGAVHAGIKASNAATYAPVVKAGVNAGVKWAAERAATGAAVEGGLAAAGLATGPPGWAITAATIAAPFILPHIPGVGSAVNKVPVIGPALSPKKGKSNKARVVALGGFDSPNPHLSGDAAPNLSTGPTTFTGLQGPIGRSSLSAPAAPQLGADRPDYAPGRGYRRK